MKKQLILVVTGSMIVGLLAFGYFAVTSSTPDDLYVPYDYDQQSQIPVQAYIPPEPQIGDIDKTTLFSEVNNYRADKGLSILFNSPGLTASAQDKCTDMVVKNYWAHRAPDGTKPATFINARIGFVRKLGENLAYDYPSADAVVSGWKISPTHNASLIDPDWNSVGYAVCKSDNYNGSGKPQVIVVQHFAKQ